MGCSRSSVRTDSAALTTKRATRSTSRRATRVSSRTAITRWIDDLARMPKIVQETLTWLPDRPASGSRTPAGKQHGWPGDAHAGGPLPGAAFRCSPGQLAGAAAFDSPCDLATQCAYLTFTATSC